MHSQSTQAKKGQAHYKNKLVAMKQSVLFDGESNVTIFQILFQIGSDQPQVEYGDEGLIIYGLNYGFINEYNQNILKQMAIVRPDPVAFAEDEDVDATCCMLPLQYPNDKEKLAELSN